jgi:hypothetical protein
MQPLSSSRKLLCRLIGALGCINHSMGFGFVWLAARGFVSLPYWLLCMFALLGSSAVVFFDQATIVTCMRNFPNERGNVGGTCVAPRSMQHGAHHLT